ncbi:MAG: tRNA lysidine(34) synthetase TilS [Kiritimatiellae bacterium]|nr:tRNA lysidine(34) synthetase TilS [Kiritimatiellia bacterium]
MNDRRVRPEEQSMQDVRYKVGLAVSGGADSVALLVLMNELRREHGFDAVVLHFDHAIRSDSAEDAKFVGKLADGFALPFYSARVKVERKKGESIEMAARRERLAFFERAMKKFKLDCIATGHHMDDVAETFLMRLKRASGADGLAGLKPVSFVDGIVFIRPLLNVRGSELREFLQSRGIGWREDSTNADTSILRNKVRHVILPFLEKELDPKIVEHICKSARYLREISLSGGRFRQKGEFQVESAPNGNPISADSRFLLTMELDKGYEVTPVDIGALPACGWFDARLLRGRTIEVRKWHDGDWMRPCGFSHRKKLQDIFVTCKTPSALRRNIPIVVDAGSGEVLWIPGYRVSETVKVSSKNADSIRLSLKLAEE